MKKHLIILFALILSSCTKKDGERATYLDSLNKEKYFSEEVLSGNYQELYGLWKAYNLYGGWSGYSKPDINYLEIKPFGIYGFVRDNTLIEYGKISPNVFDLKPYFPGYQVKLESDYTSGKNSIFGLFRYFNVIRKDTLTICDGMIDGQTYYFNRVK